MRFCELFHSVHEIIQLYLIKLGLSMSVKDLQKSIWGVVIDTRGYSWIPVFLDTWQIFGIQVSKYPKKNMFLRQTS